MKLEKFERMIATSASIDEFKNMQEIHDREIIHQCHNYDKELA